MAPAWPDAGPLHVQIGITWFLIAILGALANFAGGWLWLGAGPAMFITGLLAILLSWGSIVVMLWMIVRERTLATRDAHRTAASGDRSEGNTS